MANDGIRKRVVELKEAQSQKSELSRDQVREFLTEVILTPASFNEAMRGIRMPGFWLLVGYVHNASWFLGRFCALRAPEPLIAGVIIGSNGERGQNGVR